MQEKALFRCAVDSTRTPLLGQTKLSLARQQFELHLTAGGNRRVVDVDRLALLCFGGLDNAVVVKDNSCRGNSL